MGNEIQCQQCDSQEYICEKAYDSYEVIQQRRQLLGPTGIVYTVIAAFGYEERADYRPYEKAQLTSCSSIADGLSFADLCEASGVSEIECYFDCADLHGSNGFPSKEKIVSRLEHYAKLCGPDDAFIFVYAGHGLHSGQKGGVGILSFVDESGCSTPLFDVEVSKILQNFNPSTHVLIVTDCCNSASMCKLYNPALANHNIFHIAAANDLQEAQEVDDDGGGALTWSLLQAINGMVQQGYRHVSINDVFNVLLAYNRFCGAYHAQHFSFATTEKADPDAFRWPLMPNSDWASRMCLADMQMAMAVAQFGSLIDEFMPD